MKHAAIRLCSIIALIFLGWIPLRPAEKSSCTGLFIDKDGVRHRWTVNAAHTLIWDSKPYIPIGGVFCPPYIWDQTEAGWELTKNQIDLIRSKGIIDLCIRCTMACPSEYLQRVIDYVQKKGFCYGIEINDCPGDGPGYLIQPGKIKAENITQSGTCRVDFGDAIGGVYVVIDDDDDIVASGKARVFQSGGMQGVRQGLEADVQCPSGRKLTVYFVPVVNGGQPYFWSGGLDSFRDKLVGYFSKVRFGRGFRFVVNQFENETGPSYNFLPASDDYARRFRQWLELKYNTIARLNDAWAMITPVPDFAVASRLIPVCVTSAGAGKRGVLIDPKTEKVYVENAGLSQVWYDIVDCLGESCAESYSAICDAFKQKIADVPIVLKRGGPIAMQCVNLSASGFDGVGVDTCGVGESLIPMNVGAGWSEVEQSTRNLWFIVTGFSQTASETELGGIGHMDRESMYADLSTLFGAGAKGVFFSAFSFGPWSEGQSWMSEYIRDPRQLEWVATFRCILQGSQRLPDYRPVYYYRFPARRNELSLFGPSKADYLGIDGDWSGYAGGPGRAIMRGPDGTWVLPTWSAAMDTPLIIANLSNSPASLRYGAQLEDIISAGNTLVTYIGFRHDLGTVPSLDKYFTGMFAKDTDNKLVQVLKPTPSSKVYARTPEGHAWNLVDVNLQIISKEVSDCEGWQPEGLRIPPVDQVHEPERFLAEVLGVREFRLEPDIRGFYFINQGRHTVYLWSEKASSVIRIPAGETKEVRSKYSNGKKAGEVAKDGSLALRIPLKRRPGISESDASYVRGKHSPSEDWEDALVVEGISLEKLARPEELLPVYYSPVFPPDIWLEAEDFEDSNFNLGRYSGMTRLSGGAFWGLDTFVSPSPETGYYAKYAFEAQEEGEYDLWVRECVGMSPCHWRVNGARWVLAPESIEDQDQQVCAPWMVFGNNKATFAWRNYGKVHLRKGRNAFEIRVIAKRKKGDKYCKFLDAFAFMSQDVKPWEVSGKGNF